MFTVYDIMKEYKRLDAQTGNNIATTYMIIQSQPKGKQKGG